MFVFAGAVQGAETGMAKAATSDFKQLGRKAMGDQRQNGYEENPNDELANVMGYDLANEERAKLSTWVIVFQNGQSLTFSGGWNPPPNGSGLGDLVSDWEWFLKDGRKPPFPRRYKAYTSEDNKVHGVLGVKLEDIVAIHRALL